MADSERSSARSLMPPTTFHIDGELTIYRVVDLKAQLLAALDSTPRLAVELSGITEIDGAGLQLLIALERESTNRGVALSWGAPSPAVLGALELTGLREAFAAGAWVPRRSAPVET